ncbi:hypothetical protein QLX08_004834 [Tetragonisca angustula]|uniref:Sequestosome-1 n=1 Tax=Tetragonisca angustula TaxID=166442 RepID=A0AAW1A1C3_9HYME
MYKICLQNKDSTVIAIRKYNGPQYECFDDFCVKLKSTFPELSKKKFIVSWQDNEGDEIVISSDEELEIAQKEMFSPKKFNVKLVSSKQEIPSSKKDNKAIHFGICCDGCDGDIIGFRYKCIQCEDYDLCAQCERTMRHSHHYMIRMPQPLQWHHSRSLIHHLRKILKKNGVHLNKKHASNENTSHSTSQGIHSSIYPWLESYAPYLNNIIDTVLETSIGPELFKNQKPEKKEESNNDTHTSNNDTHTNENDSRKFPGEGRKLLDDTKDDKGSISDVASTSSQDNSTIKVVADEWTIIDKNDTTEIIQTPLTSFNANETNIKQVPSSSTAPSAPEGSSTQTLYPELPKEKKVVHHENPRINEAIETMLKMGFSNQSGLLTYLLDAENGDINKVLEILQPTNK